MTVSRLRILALVHRHLIPPDKSWQSPEVVFDPSVLALMEKIRFEVHPDYEKLLTGHAASGMVKHGFINTAAMLATVDRATAAFDVRKAKRDPEAASLSGGNLQKFIVGREILRNPAVLVVSQPTWGVDAGAAAVIRQALLDLAASGAAVLVTSQDLDELVEVTDRIAVIFHGRLSEPLPTADANREKLGLLMGGSSLEQKDAAHAVSA